jgi:beta-galactosidase
LLDGYRPDAPEIGVVFSEANHQLDWAQNGNSAGQSWGSVTGWLSLFERVQLPYAIVDGHRPSGLDGIRLLFMPWPLVVPPVMAAAIVEWVRAGGVLVTESELDAFDEQGFYRYPAERPLASALGIRSLGRRILEDGSTVLLGTGTDRAAIPSAVWLEALDASDAEVLGTSASGDTVATRRQLGAGSVIALGTFSGLGYARARHEGLEAFARRTAALAGVTPALTVSPDDGEILQWRSGLSGRSRLLFLTADASVGHAIVSGGRELLDGQKIWSVAGGSAGVPRYSDDNFELDVTLSEDGIAVLAWGGTDT